MGENIVLDKQLLLFGLMRKAGRLAVGDEPVTDALRRGEVYVVCVASDAADNTVTRFRRFTEEEEIPFLPLRFDKKTFGGVFGRRDVAVAGVTDLGFAARLLELDETAAQTDAAKDYRARADRQVEEQRKKRRKPPVWQSKAPAPEEAAPPAPEKAPEGKPAPGRAVPKRRESPAPLPQAEEKKPFENREGKIYGKAPRAQHASIGDRRREDAAKKAARSAEHGLEPPRSGGYRRARPAEHPAPEKKPYNSRSYGKGKPYGGKKPYDGERKPYGEKPYGGEHKPYGEKSYGGEKPYDGERKPHGEKKPYGRQGSYGERGFYGEKRPYDGEKGFHGEKKPYGRKPGGQKNGAPAYNKAPHRTNTENAPRPSGKRGNGGKA